MRFKYLLFILFSSAVFAFLVLFSSNAPASLIWQQTNGPYGGNVYSIAVSPSDPSVVYLGTEWSGMYVSSNSGESWSIKNNGLLNLSVRINDIAVNPYNPDKAYIATNGTGIAATANRGGVWEAKNKNLGPIVVIYGIDIDPRNPDNIYAATYSGLKKSTDEGSNWGSGGLEGLKITSIRIVSAESHSVIYAGTEVNGVWKSTNEALSWTNILTNEPVTAIGVSRSSPESFVYAGVRRVNYYKITRTKNGGSAWSDTNYNPTNNTSAKWKVNFIAVHPSSPEVALAAPGASGFPNGIYKTTNEVSWTQKSPDPNPNFVFLDVSFAPGNPKRMYTCGIGGGFYTSTNEGESWKKSNSKINNVYISVLLVATSETGPIVFAGTQYDGVYRSVDGGGSWEEVNNGISLSRRVIYSLVQDPISKEVIYAGAADVSGAGTVYRSTDKGSTWEEKFSVSRIPSFIAIDPISHEVVYLGVSGTPYFYRSPNAGGTWEVWNTGLLAAVDRIIVTSFEGKSYVHASSIPPSPGGGAYRRMSDGSAWESVSGGISGLRVRYFAPNYATPEAIYSAVNSLLYSKTVEGTTWLSNISLPQDYAISHLVADPLTPSTIYASAFGRGIFKILDFGSSRVREETGLEATRVTDFPMPMAIDIYSTPRALYAEVSFRSVWKATALAGDVPDTPANLTGQAMSSRSIKWAWVDNSYNESGFRVKDGLTLTNIATVGVDSVEFTETGLSTNTAFTRKVAGYNANGESIPSNPFTAFTLANTPGIPTSAEVGGTNIKINWGSNSNPHNISFNTSYEVYRSTPEGFSGLPIYWQYVSTVTTTEYPDTGLSFETTYFYMVRALNGDGIPTGFATSEGFITGTPVPSNDVLPPRITSVRFDGRAYYNGNIIYHTPRITATIRDYASSEAPYFVTPEGVDRNSVKIRFDNYVFDIPLANVIPQGGPITVEVDFRLPARLGSSSYICTIEATDSAYPWYNKATWTGVVKVMGDRVNVVGNPLSYPTTFKPLSGGYVTLSYTLSTNADITLFMYDVSGQIILTRKFGAGRDGGKAGYNQFIWNGRADFGKVAGNGIYVYKIVSGGRVIGTGKLVVLD